MHSQVTQVLILAQLVLWRPNDNKLPLCYVLRLVKGHSILKYYRNQTAFHSDLLTHQLSWIPRTRFQSSRESLRISDNHGFNSHALA